MTGHTFAQFRDRLGREKVEVAREGEEAGVF